MFVYLRTEVKQLGKRTNPLIFIGYQKQSIINRTKLSINGCSIDQIENKTPTFFFSSYTKAVIKSLVVCIGEGFRRKRRKGNV